MTRRRRGLALSELLLGFVALTLVLGVVVSLARRVRRDAAHGLAGRVLADLDAALAEYRRTHRADPDVPPLLAGGAAAADGAVLRERGGANALGVAAALGVEPRADPWGTPIVYVAGYDPQLGMAAGGRAFFMSAGPDRRYLTRDDNLYSYEAARPAAAPAGPGVGVDSP